MTNERSSPVVFDAENTRLEPATPQRPYPRLVFAQEAGIPSRDAAFYLLAAWATTSDRPVVVCRHFLPGAHLYLLYRFRRDERGQEILVQDWARLARQIEEWLVQQHDAQAEVEIALEQGKAVLCLGVQPRLERDLAVELVLPAQGGTRPPGQRAPTAVATWNYATIAMPGVHSALLEAMRRVQDATTAPGLSRLPLPVRVRANGAVSAWNDLKALVPLQPVLAALADKDAEIDKAVRGLHGLAGTALGQEYNPTLTELAGLLLAFHLRRGALYEPTLPLSALLGATDWATDVPLRFVRLPVQALAIVPPPGHRPCGEVSTIQVFCHPCEIAAEQGARVVRKLTFIAHMEDRSLDLIQVTIGDEEGSLSAAMQRNREWFLQADSARYGADVARHRLWRWSQVWDYAIKVLLYLNLEDAVVNEDRAYTTAPRQFPGLGRRKREAKLAEIEMLYDRYLVGPARLPESCTDSGGKGDHRGEEGRADTPPHWRRGHFRLQPHGPQNSLRKLLFIAPTIVRADRFGR